MPNFEELIIDLKYWRNSACTKTFSKEGQTSDTTAKVNFQPFHNQLQKSHLGFDGVDFPRFCVSKWDAV